MRKKVIQNIRMICALALAVALLVPSALAAGSTSTVISDIRANMENFVAHKVSRQVSDRCLETLVTQLFELEDAVKASGSAAGEDVFKVLDETETAIRGRYSTDASVKALIALRTVRDHLSGRGFNAGQTQAPVPQVTSFTDLDPGHWAYKAVMECVNRGAINGTTTPVDGVGTYNPGGKVMLGEFLTVFAKLIAADKIPAYVEGTHWSTPYYEAAILSGLIGPSEYSTEDLTKLLNRQGMAHFMVGIAKLNGETLSSIPDIENVIPDYNEIGASYRSDVLQCYSNGLITGADGNAFYPKGTMTRAEMAMVIARLMNYIDRAEVLIPSQPGGTVIVPDSGYGHYVVTDEGETQGMLRASYATKFNLEALSMVRTGEDEKGVYVIYTAPVLPAELQEDFVFSFNMTLYDKDDNYLQSESNRAELKSGESIKSYFVGRFTDYVSAKDIASARIGVSVQNASHRHVYVLGSSINFYDKTTVTEKYYDGYYEFQTLDINVANEIWKGIGK